MTPAERPQWNSSSLLKLLLWCQAPVLQSSSLCLLVTHSLSCKQVLTPEICIRHTPMCVITWSGDCHYRWWQLHLFMRAAGCSLVTELQTSHMNHRPATIVSWRLYLKNDIGTKSCKNIPHLAAELRWAALNFKYTKTRIQSEMWYTQCSDPCFHSVVITVNNVSVIFSN